MAGFLAAYPNNIVPYSAVKNPKSEGPSPKECRNPNAKKDRNARELLDSDFGLRISSFGFGEREVIVAPALSAGPSSEHASR
jgi:hypothetical protein